VSLAIWEAVKAIPIMTIAEEINLQIIKDSGSYATAVCIFHQDHVGSGGKANLSLLKTKNSFKCFVCGAHGTVLDLYAKACGIEPLAAVHALAEKFHIMDPSAKVGVAPAPTQKAPAGPPEAAAGKPEKKKDPDEVWDLARVQKASDFLMDPKNDGHLQHLVKMRQLTKEYVAKKRFGLAHVYGIGLCYTIPAFDVDGTILSVRTHSRISRKDKRFIPGMKSKHLYDLASFDPNAPEIHFVEGEGCVWRLELMGKNAISSFAGAPTIPGVVVTNIARLGDLATKTRIVFYTDNDKPGEECMAKIRHYLTKEAKCFKTYWPTDYPKGKDVDDWFAMGRSEAELNLLIKPYPWEEADSLLTAIAAKKKAVEISRRVYEHSNCYFKVVKPKKADEACECEHKKSDHVQLGQLADGTGFSYGKCSRKSKKDLSVPCHCTTFELPHEEGEQIGDEDELSKFADRLSTFVIRGRALLKVDREVHTRADVITWDGKVEKDIIFPPDAWRSRQKLTSYLPDPHYEFTGTDNDVAQIGGLVIKTVADTEVKKAVNYIGFVDDCFVGPGFAIDKTGVVQNPSVEYIPQGLTFDKSVKLHVHDNPKEVLGKFCDIYLKVNRAHVTIPTLGWLFACFFKDKVRDRLNYFPIMSYFGTSGSGKTQFTTTMLRIFGIKKLTPFNAHGSTFVKDRTLSSTNVIPVAVDEFKEDIGRVAIEDWKHRIRSSFGGEITARGRQDLSIREFPFRAPLLVIGEMSVVREQAIAERTISVEPKRSYLGTVESEAFKTLTHIPMETMLLPIVQWVLATGHDKMYDLWGAAQKEMIEMKLPWLPDRVWHNLTTVCFGLHAFEMFANDTGVKFVITPELKKEAFNYLTGRVLEVAQRTKMGFDYLIEALSVMAKGGIVQKAKGDYDVAGEWLYIHMPSCVPAFRKWARETGFNGEMLDLKEYRNQASEIEKMQYGRYVYDVSKSRRLDQHVLRTVQVNLKIADRFGLDVGGFGWSSEQVGYEQDLPASGTPEEQLPAELTAEDNQKTLFETPPAVAPAEPLVDDTQKEDDIFG
jgi:hypothetical protein